MTKRRPYSHHKIPWIPPRDRDEEDIFAWLRRQQNPERPQPRKKDR